MKNKNLQQTAIGIESIVNEIFDHHSRLIRYLGKRIADPENVGDLKYIHYIMRNVSAGEFDTMKILSWSLFDWVAADSRQRVNVKDGIVHASQFLNDKKILEKAKNDPWKLHLSSPRIGHVSGEWVIPAVYGIRDDDTFLGVISMGFHIHNLNRILKDRLLLKNSSSFIILNEFYDIILQSSDNNLSDNSDYFKELLKEDDSNYFSDRNMNFLNEPINCNSLEYRYYKKMDNYPYIILTGLNKDTIHKETFHLIFPSIGELVCIIGLILTIFYIHHKRYAETAHASDKAKQQVIHKTIQPLREGIKLLCQHSNILSQYFKSESNILIPLEKQIELLSHIQNSAVRLQKFSIIHLDKSYVNIDKLIKEVVTIHSHNAIIKNVYLTTEIQPDISPIYADELGLKQILISLISHSFESIPSGGNINISVFMLENNLNIIFTDNGFGLSDEEINRISQKFPDEHAHNADLINFDIGTIMNLVELHKGTYTLKSVNGNGRIVVLKFPYVTPTTNKL